MTFVTFLDDGWYSNWVSEARGKKPGEKKLSFEKNSEFY